VCVLVFCVCVSECLCCACVVCCVCVVFCVCVLCVCVFCVYVYVCEERRSILNVDTQLSV
jgi:hypothetical protein